MLRKKNSMKISARNAFIHEDRISWLYTTTATSRFLSNDDITPMHLAGLVKPGNLQKFGRVANVYLHHNDAEKPVRFEATTSSCYFSELDNPHWVKWKVENNGPLYTEFTPFELIKALFQDRFAPSSAVVLVYFLLHMELIPGDHHRLEQLRQLCEGQPVTNGYPYTL